MPVYDATITLEDAYTRRTTKRFQVDAVDFVTAQTATILLVSDLDALSEAQVIAYTVGLKASYSGSLVAGANLDEGITLSVRKTDNQKAVLKVPAPANAVINPDGTVDITNALVTDYVDAWLAEGWLISDGETVVELLSGKLDR